MTLRPMFFAQFDLEFNKQLNERITTNDASINAPILININGIKTNLWALRTNFWHNYAKLTRLICFLNPEGPRKILDRDNLSKANFIDSIILKDKKHHEKMEYSHIEICLKFENLGNFFINVLNNYNGWFEFYVKIKKANEKRCFYKIFKKISDLEKKVLKSLRHGILVYISKTDIVHIEDGQIYVDNVDLMSRFNNIKIIAIIEPLIDDGSYEFYLDKDGLTKERVKINETNY